MTKVEEAMAKAHKHIAAAEDDAKKLNRKGLEAHYVTAIANWNLVMDERDELIKELAAVRAEQQPLAHVANCKCCSGCQMSPGKCRDHLNNPYTDSRCRPGLLHDAEVRLETTEILYKTFTESKICSEMPMNTWAHFLQQFSAAVERLKGEK